MNQTLDALRARIREIEGRPAGGLGEEPSGFEALDRVVGGLPRPGAVEVLGGPGAGGTRLVLSWAAARTQAGERVAWVDAEGLLHPPTAHALGVHLNRLVLVRPPLAQVTWSVEQLLGSGCMAMVVVAAPPREQSAGARWIRSVRRGQCTLVVVGRHPVQGLGAQLRLEVTRDQVTVRRRRGAGGARTPVPAWPEERDPWA